jgi:hypothetical protein
MSLDTDLPPTEWGTGVEPLDVQPDPPASSGGLADRIRGQQRQKKAGFHLDLKVPTLDVVVRYRPLKGGVIENLQKKKPDPQHGKDLTVAIDALARACERVFVYAPDDPRAPKDGDDEGLVPFEDVFELDGSGPVTLKDPRLAEALEYPGSTTREIVVGLFPTDGAVLNAFQRINVWNANVDAEVTEGLSGE